MPPGCSRKKRSGSFAFREKGVICHLGKKKNMQYAGSFTSRAREKGVICHIFF